MANRLHYTPYPSWARFTGSRTNFIRARTTSRHGPSTGEILVRHGWDKVVYTTISIRAEPIFLVRVLFYPSRTKNFLQCKWALRQLENEDIIERAEGPTLWVSPIVVVPKPSKPNEIRIHVDMRCHNQAIIRERLTMWCQTSTVAKSLVKLILIKGTTRPRSTLIRDNSRRSLPRLGYFATSGLNLVSLSCGSLPKERE